MHFCTSFPWHLAFLKCCVLFLKCWVLSGHVHSLGTQSCLLHTTGETGWWLGLWQLVPTQPGYQCPSAALHSPSLKRCLKAVKMRAHGRSRDSFQAGKGQAERQLFLASTACWNPVFVLASAGQRLSSTSLQKNFLATSSLLSPYGRAGLKFSLAIARDWGKSWGGSGLMCVKTRVG